MARKLRVEFEGAVYHVMNRGDQRERIFVDEEDRKLFLADAGRSLCEDRMASPCVLFDEQSFPSGRGDTSGQFVRGHAVVPGNLHGPL